MIAANDRARHTTPRNGNGHKNGNAHHVKRCITFDRTQLADLQELAWAANVPVDALVREAVDRYRQAPSPNN